MGVLEGFSGMRFLWLLAAVVSPCWAVRYGAFKFRAQGPGLVILCSLICSNLFVCLFFCFGPVGGSVHPIQGFGFRASVG